VLTEKSSNKDLGYFKRERKMSNSLPKLIDVHVHVGLLGNRWPEWGRLSEWYRQQLNYKIFLLFAGIEADKVSDTLLHDTIIKTIDKSCMEKVVCLALDPVYDSQGKRCESASNVWVDNEYILQKLQKDSNKVLFGASVHPYDPEFKVRVKKYVDKGAVLLKWVPSAQQINLADDRTVAAMEFLADVKDGKPLPLLLHVGPEYAIPTTDDKTFTNDFLSWSWIERVRNWFRFGNRWNTPQVKKIKENLSRALKCGETIIFAHCGLPYFASGLFAFLEHSDFDVIRSFIEKNNKNIYKGKCYADISACCTPFRRDYFKDIAGLQPEYLIFGSDFPTPVFEIYSDIKEMKKDFKAMLKGHLERIVVPQDNLLDVNYRYLRQAFPSHPLFTNFSKLIDFSSP
jgi:predicted TIM-barrel fold metal-dependent hydrolase